ncbi:hypothetical protein CONLIGDRAFT_685433 [Coniochaeta ligniaria NRRL 30616]|uniref:NADH dehydrogenase [ubiquinone] 1 alpha subcomplex subunit 1 n=1 Tax=Coniochaeta ligniaria NRRL 30616 TaxID=1408157 RepID=A0A1J7J5N5_9PEZI|nr:hypothetical protein CONLIGDRAFT_685433 [Coniochaeta ligniaria NRRL 30616]
MAQLVSQMETHEFGATYWELGLNVIAMPVPFETLIPYGIIIAMFGVTGAGLSKIKHMQNGGKRARRSIDQWDRQMMERDRRLTGMLRGQTDSPIAPDGFELSNAWKTERRIA